MVLKKFAGIVDGDVFTVLTIDQEYSGADGQTGARLIAGFSSQPEFVEIPVDSEVGIYWTWDGASFSQPS